MPSIKSILRRRAARRSQTDLAARVAPPVLWLLGALLLSTMFAVFLIGFFFNGITKDLPQISELDLLFAGRGDEFPELSFVYDRLNEEQLFPLQHPSAASRLWLSADLNDANSIPLAFIVPFLAIQDDSFWITDGIDGGKFIEALLAILSGIDDSEIYHSIPQRLAEIILLPASDFNQGTLIRYLKSATLAQTLDERFSKEQLLEWYLNLADFGNFAFGLDAASLVYYGKHATQLSDGEGTMLATLPRQATNNPIDNYARARENQILILSMMEQRELISRIRMVNALNEPQPSYAATDEFGLMKFAEQRLRSILGSELIARPGLNITTTIDRQLQFELRCTAEIYLSLPPNLMEAGSETCNAAQLLPLTRVDRQMIEQGAIIVLDPTTGEIVGSYGHLEIPRTAEAMLNPFSFLTAFSRGFSPATMVLDLPIGEEQEGIQSHGPVRMRSALIGGYLHAAERVEQLVGEQAVLDVIRQMGILRESPQRTAAKTLDALTPNLLDLVNAYSVIANQGLMVGQNQSSTNALQSLFITRIVDGSQLEIYNSQPEQRSILSPGLAYLLVDVLADSAARQEIIGNPNIFDLDTLAAVVTENFMQPERESWTIGFTPTRVVGVWVGTLNSGTIGVLDGAAPLWHAIMDYVSQDSGSQGWELPSGVRTLEVCDPSGKLPTEHCPIVVEEVFIEGTEPLLVDDLYQAIRLNRETGKLATVFTPWELVEEQLYFLPPFGATMWAVNNGFALPPSEYDPIFLPAEPDGVSITFPRDFAFVKGKVFVRGSASGKDFTHYRLAFGQGLNPSEWFIIDEQQQAVDGGLLGVWDTEKLDGIMTLQLIAVDEEGTASMVYQPITVDNQPPQIETFNAYLDDQSLMLSVHAQDNIAPVRVDFYLDGLKIASTDHLPFEAVISLELEGHYEVFARVYDAAGNVSEDSASKFIDIQS